MGETGGTIVVNWLVVCSVAAVVTVLGGKGSFVVRGDGDVLAVNGTEEQPSVPAVKNQRTMWSDEGYKAIGMTASSGLTSAGLMHIKRIFQKKDFADLSSWYIGTVDKSEDLQNLQLVMYNTSSSNKTAENAAISDINACHNVAVVPSDDAFALPTIINVIVNSLTNPLYRSPHLQHVANFSNAEKVAVLFFLVANLHQPAAYEDVASSLTWNQKLSMTLPHLQNGNYSLSEIFTHLLLQWTIAQSPNTWNSGWTHVFSKGEKFNSETDAFKKRGIAIINDWALEIAKLSCTIKYTALKNQETSQVSYSDFNRWQDVIRNLILDAGIRVAVIMNHIMRERGSDIYPMQLQPSHAVLNADGAQPANNSDWRQNLLTNIGILFFVAILMFCFTEFYSSSFKVTPYSSIEPTSSSNAKKLDEKRS